jgi:NADP-reducing hydrogenase subunit HndA
MREDQIMQKRKTNVPFEGTKEQEQKLIEIIESHKNEKGPLMPILQEAQELYGYLPIEVQQIVAEKMGMPLEEIYGVVSFYAQFTLNPSGKYKISVCLGTACYVKGSHDILERLSIKLGIKPGEITTDGKFSLESTRCIGACGLAPIVTVNDEVFGRLVPDDVDKILAKYN